MPNPRLKISTYIFLVRVFGFIFYVLISDPFYMWREIEVHHIHFCVNTQLFQHHLLKSPFSPLNFLDILVEKWMDHKYGGLFLNFQFYFIALCVCHYASTTQSSLLQLCGKFWISNCKSSNWLTFHCLNKLVQVFPAWKRPWLDIYPAIVSPCCW